MKVFCAGFNLYGQFNTTQECIDVFTCINYTDVCDLSLSHSFTILKTVENNTLKSNRIYVRGFLKNGVNQNEELDFDDEVVQISVSDSRALFLCRKQQIFCLQYNSNGSLDLLPLPKFIGIDLDADDGQVDTISKISSGICMSNACSNRGYIYNIPSKLDCEPLNIVDMSTGREHCLILTVDGSVFSFGGGSRGQLGHGDVEDRNLPERIKCLEGIKISKIACGAWHSVALSASGDVYTWGWNSNGQLGHVYEEPSSEHITIIASPQVVDFEENVTDICCGSRHTVILTENSKLYGCGWNKYHQLGIPNNCENCYKMSFLYNFHEFDIIGLRCGTWNTAVLVTD